MRPFEMLLFFSNLGLFIVSIIPKNNIRSMAVLITSGVNAVFLTIHLIAEGFRLQILFLYIYTVLMIIVSIVNYPKVPVSRPALRIKQALCTIFAAAAFLITAGLMYAFPVFKLPAPTGTFKVGTQALHFVDKNRKEIFDKNVNSNRELMVQVWYPAQNTGGKPSLLIPDAQLLHPMSKNYGLPGFTFDHLKYVISHSFKGADISSVQSSYPLVIVNPGFGSSRFLHTSQAEDLASHGYIVAVIDHTYNTFATVFPDGRITACKTNEYFSPTNDYQTETGNRDKVGKVLTDDVAFVLNQFELVNTGKFPSNLKGRLDMDHIGVSGHSIGGATAYDSSFDSRITAGIDLDGGLYRVREKSELKKPFLFICSEGGYEELKNVMNNHAYTDEELKEMGNTREWQNKVTENKKAEIELMKKTSLSGGQIVYIENLVHLNFTDVQFFSPIFKVFGITGKIDPERADSIVNAYMLDFFDRYLKNKNGNLLIGPNERYPEVKFVTSLFGVRK